MKKVLFLILPALFIASAGFAEGHGKEKFKHNMTDEQKACVESHGCPKMDFKKGDLDKEAMKEGRECKKRAFESCGVEKPEKKDGEKKMKKKSW